MRVIMTGANNPFGREALLQFGDGSMSVSRSNGFDIGDELIREKIAEMSLQYDIAINHAHNGHFSGQTELLYKISEKWKVAQKQGLIISTGSIAATCAHQEFKRYAVIKKGLELANQQIAKMALDQGLPFRTVVVHTGTLGNSDRGLSGAAYGETIKMLYKLLPNIYVSEIQVNGESR